MYAIVRLRLFSGLDNPEWRLDGTEANDWYQRILHLPVLARSAWVQPNARLGYRGMEIKVVGNNEEIIAQAVFFASSADDRLKGGFFADKERSFEQQLFESARGDAMSGLQGLTWATVNFTGNETPIGGLNPPGKPSGRCAIGASAPGSKPWLTHASYNNCYNYANDKLNSDSTEKAALPGVMKTRRPSKATELKNLLRQEITTDDLVRFGSDSVPVACPPQGHHYLVVIIRDAHPATTAKDFHCIRLDKNGKWSHLDASGFPRTDDDALQEITDITEAVFDGNPELVGVYLAKKNNPKIQ